MKLVITGSNGFVAGSVIVAAPEKWELHGFGRSELSTEAGDGPVSRSGNGSSSRPGDGAGKPGDRVVYHRVDLQDGASLEAALRGIKPDVILHAAAMANIDFCESNPELARAVNLDSTVRIATVANEIGARVIFCSTDTVFDGKRGLYTERDEPAPVNYYGETKVRAEEVVLAANGRNCVARLALVMGWPVLGKGNTFLPDLIGRLERNEAANFAVNEIRSPIDVLTLGEALIELAGSDFGGIVHLSGSTPINRYDMACKIARLAGYPAERITPVNSNALPGRAPRPDNASMDNTQARNLLSTPMLDIDAGLARCFNQLKK